MKKNGGTRQGPHQSEKKEEQDEEKEDGAGKEDEEGKIDGSRKDEDRTQHDRHEQRVLQHKEGADEAIIADVAAATAGPGARGGHRWHDARGGGGQGQEASGELSRPHQRGLSPATDEDSWRPHLT